MYRYHVHIYVPWSERFFRNSYNPMGFSMLERNGSFSLCHILVFHLSPFVSLLLSSIMGSHSTMIVRVKCLSPLVSDLSCFVPLLFLPSSLMRKCKKYFAGPSHPSRLGFFILAFFALNAAMNHTHQQSIGFDSFDSCVTTLRCVQTAEQRFP